FILYFSEDDRHTIIEFKLFLRGNNGFLDGTKLYFY
ncbi:MAG: hypothetical protein K1060chlam2_00327, partial [Chlamydiae bacterium]|nr:hypothetical protein [Chlamydiota bacterium]